MRLQNHGFKPAVKRAIPFVSLYRSAEAKDVQESLQQGSTVKFQGPSDSVILSSASSADVLASALDHDPKLNLKGLSGMSTPTQERVLAGLTTRSVSARATNLRRMAEFSVSPGSWQGQLAQLAARPGMSVLVESKSELNGRIPDLKDLDSLDSQAKELGIDFGYLSGYCEARGHLLCDMLRKQGINSQKIFAEGFFTVPDGEVAYDGRAREANHWGFHTAPVVWAQTDDGVQPRVWDPTLAQHRGDESSWYSPEEWLGGFEHRGETKVRVTDDTEYSPYRTFQGSFDSNVKFAQKEMEWNNKMAQSKRFKLETIGPLMNQLQGLSEKAKA